MEEGSLINNPSSMLGLFVAIKTEDFYQSFPQKESCAVVKYWEKHFYSSSVQYFSVGDAAKLLEKLAAGQLLLDQELLHLIYVMDWFEQQANQSFIDGSPQQFCHIINNYLKAEAAKHKM